MLITRPLPVVVVVLGRPNVGKSTLRQPGLPAASSRIVEARTGRDSRAAWRSNREWNGESRFWSVDTGGVVERGDSLD